MPQQRVENRRAALADFASVRARAMLHLEPVRFDLQKSFVARKFFRRGGIRRKFQPRGGGGFDFCYQILHGRINCGENDFKASAASADFVLILILILISPLQITIKSRIKMLTMTKPCRRRGVG